MINSYNVVLTDKNGPVSYEIGRVNLAAFIAGVNWDVVTSLSVEPIDPEGLLDDWEDELLVAPEEEWKTIDKLPTRSFEINRAGKIRHKNVKKILSPSLDLDSRNYMTVSLKINGLNYYIDGPALANEMWSVPV